MSTYVDAKIAEKEQELAELDRRREVVNAELRAYRDIQKNAEGAAATPSAPKAAKPNAKRKRRKSRQSAEHWQSAMSQLAGKEFRASDVNDVLLGDGVVVKLATIRSKLFNLVSTGALERVGEGLYRVSRKGSFFGISTKTAAPRHGAAA